MTDMNSFCKE